VIWILYNVLFLIGYMLLLPRFMVRMARRGGYRKDFMQRFGVFSEADIARLRAKPRIWIHAVSVGEMLIALKFMEEYRAGNPGMAFFLTTTTSTGHGIAAKRMNSDDVLAYFPVDLPVFMSRELDLVQPRAVILIESELWPNLIRLAKWRGIPAILVNGRISARSVKGYRIVRVFFEKAINMMSLLCVQTPEDAQRLIELGASESSIKVMGTAKYDVADINNAAASGTERLLKKAGVGPGSLLLVGGSTWPGEETILLGIFKRLRESIPGLRLVLVPRHAERAAKVTAEIRNNGLSEVRWSALAGDGSNPAGDVILVDTTGELMGLYSCATVVFVGKSLTEHGGQNVIEPALFGKPIIVGPNMENFEGVMRDFKDSVAIVQVRDAVELEHTIESFLLDGDRRRAIGQRARSVVKGQRGVVSATAGLVRDLLSIRQDNRPV